MSNDPCSYDTDHYYNYLSKQIESMNYKLELNELQRELHKKDMRIAELEKIIDDIIIDSHGRYGTVPDQ